jgi:hypothetical protein
MRFPQVSDRVKEAPAQALRGLFAGIGQLLLFTDKLKNKDKAAPAQQLPPSRAPRALEVASLAVVPPPVTAVTPSADAPATQQPAAAADSIPAATDPAPAATDAPRPATETRPPAGEAAAVPEVPAAVPEEAATAEDAMLPFENSGPPAAAEAGLPLANYDQLSLASLRGRLRSLDVAQLRQLISYEREHAARADVLAMFERRVTKLETGA